MTDKADTVSGTSDLSSTSALPDHRSVTFYTASGDWTVACTDDGIEVSINGHTAWRSDRADAQPLPRGKVRFLGGLPLPGDFEPEDFEAAPGHGFVIIEMTYEDLRRCPFGLTVEVRPVQTILERALEIQAEEADVEAIEQ